MAITTQSFILAPFATKSAKGITSATVVKASGGYVASVTVIVAGSAPGSVNDVATTGAAAASNQVYVVPNTVGTYAVNFPVSAGIVVVPGTGQTIAIAYA
jgi:hypothetical protein